MRKVGCLFSFSKYRIFFFGGGGGFRKLEIFFRENIGRYDQCNILILQKRLVVSTRR